MQFPEVRRLTDEEREERRDDNVHRRFLKKLEEDKTLSAITIQQIREKLEKL